jgi:hypothetical protein
VIKKRIDEVEKLSEEEVEVLITMIRSLSKPKSGKYLISSPNEPILAEKFHNYLNRNVN